MSRPLAGIAAPVLAPFLRQVPPAAADAPDLFPSAGEASRSAGSFVSRDLLFTDCTATAPSRRAVRP